MSIPVTCDSCGKRLKIPDKLAGKKAKCPKCSTVLRIPGSGPSSARISSRSSSRRESAGKSCPSCDRSMGSDDVFCVGCGYDLRTGKKVPGI